MYARYPKRACENLGVSSKKDEEENEPHDFEKEIEIDGLDLLSEDEYPEELKGLLKGR